MRVIKYLLFFLITGLALVCIGFVVSQRVLLLVGEKQLTQSLKSLMAASRQQIYYNQCQQLNRQYGLESNSTIFQLRFINDQEYLLETVCQALPDRPNEIGRGKLPDLLSKIPGSSGFILNQETTQVRLQVLREVVDQLAAVMPWLESGLRPEVVITVSDSQIIDSSDLLNVLGPNTDCAGFGFKCCAEVIEKGSGQQITAQDCSGRCFASCQSLPAVLAFTAAPGFDQFSRSIDVTSGQQVEFWTVSNADENLLQVINFGDGNSHRDQSQIQPVIHQYSCLTNICEYNAEVQLEDENGVKSIVSPVSTIKVTVRVGQ